MELESPLQRPVIVLGPNHLARHSVEEAAESAERQGLRASTTYAGARVQEAQQIQAVRDTQLELDSHFVAVRGGRGGRGGRERNCLGGGGKTCERGKGVGEACVSQSVCLLACIGR